MLWGLRQQCARQTLKPQGATRGGLAGRIPDLNYLKTQTLSLIIQGCRGSQPGRLESPMASLCAETQVGLGRSPAAPRRQAPEQYSKLAIAVLSLA